MPAPAAAGGALSAAVTPPAAADGALGCAVWLPEAPGTAPAPLVTAPAGTLLPAGGLGGPPPTVSMLLGVTPGRALIAAAVALSELPGATLGNGRNWGLPVCAYVGRTDAAACSGVSVAPEGAAGGAGLVSLPCGGPCEADTAQAKGMQPAAVHPCHTQDACRWGHNHLHAGAMQQRRRASGQNCQSKPCNSAAGYTGGWRGGGLPWRVGF